MSSAALQPAPGTFSALPVATAANNAAVALISYINAHGCDNSVAFHGLVTALQAATNAATKGNTPKLPVDGVYTAAVQEVLSLTAKFSSLPFTPCNLTAPTTTTATTTVNNTTNTTTTPSTTSTTTYLLIGGGVLLAGLLAYIAMSKKKR